MILKIPKNFHQKIRFFFRKTIKLTNKELEVTKFNSINIKRKLKKSNSKLTDKLIVAKELQIVLGAMSTFIKNKTFISITKPKMYTF